MIVFITWGSLIGLLHVIFILSICRNCFSHCRLFHRRKKRPNQAVVHHTPPAAVPAAPAALAPAAVVQNNEIPLIIPVFSSVEVSLVEEKPPPQYIEEHLPSYESVCIKTMTTRLWNHFEFMIIEIFILIKTELLYCCAMTSVFLFINDNDKKSTSSLNW